MKISISGGVDKDIRRLSGSSFRTPVQPHRHNVHLFNKLSQSKSQNMAECQEGLLINDEAPKRTLR